MFTDLTTRIFHFFTKKATSTPRTPRTPPTGLAAYDPQAGEWFEG